MEINGPYVTKPVVIPEHVEHHLDPDAYWNLDYWGVEDADGGFLYAKVAWPSVRDAQRQHEMSKQARETERREAAQRTKQERARKRADRKIATAGFRGGR